MGYEINNELPLPEVVGKVPDLLTPEYVYGTMESESGDPFYRLGVKFFDDPQCTIPSDTSGVPLTLEIYHSPDEWRPQTPEGVTGSSFTFRCGIPHNTIPDTLPSRELYVRIRGWRIPNPTGLESIENYVRCVGKITLNPTLSVRKLTITWL